MPIPKVRSSGVTEMEAMVGAVIVSAVDPVTLPSLALMVAAPALTPLAMPEASIVAIETDEELHATSALRSLVLPSL